MMDISRTEGVHGPGRIEGKRIHAVNPPQVQPPQDAASRVEVSQVGRLVSEAISLPDVRMDKVTEFSRLIKAGIYMSDDRLIGALEKFRQEISGQ
jgi:hypothetical protein